MPLYARKVRYRTLERLRHSTNFLAFLIAQALRLSGTGTGQTVTFTNATNLVNYTAHGYVDGQGPFVLSNSAGALPVGLNDATNYWVNVNDVNSITLHLTESAALAGLSVVTFVDDGTGTNQILVAAEQSDIFNAMVFGKSADQIRALTTIDNL